MQCCNANKSILCKQEVTGINWVLFSSFRWWLTIIWRRWPCIRIATKLTTISLHKLEIHWPAWWSRALHVTSAWRWEAKYFLGSLQLPKKKLILICCCGFESRFFLKRAETVNQKPPCLVWKSIVLLLLLTWLVIFISRVWSLMKGWVYRFLFYCSSSYQWWLPRGHRFLEQIDVNQWSG